MENFKNNIHIFQTVQIEEKFYKRKRDRFIIGEINAIYPLTGIEVKLRREQGYRWMAWSHIENITPAYYCVKR